ncbi:hypothetical protein LTR08_004303 [Meristemomyces frigidus]|nr:hypothetical protein LTR08_004303 [Meristemomyces frigidus]
MFNDTNNYDLNAICDYPLLTTEYISPSPSHGSDASIDFTEVNNTNAGIQTVRTCGTVIEATEPDSPETRATSRQIAAGIDDIIAKATADGKYSQGHAKWSLDRYDRAYTYGARH